jgi:hypothetical protein
MEDALVHAWDQMRTDMAHNFVGSVRERVEAVIASKGWYMRFGMDSKRPPNHGFFVYLRAD